MGAWLSRGLGCRSDAASTTSSPVPVRDAPGPQHGTPPGAAAEWLASLGLSQYSAACEATGFNDMLVLAYLNEDDLDTIAQATDAGTILPGHRKKLLLASAMLARSQSASGGVAWPAADDRPHRQQQQQHALAPGAPAPLGPPPGHSPAAGTPQQTHSSGRKRWDRSRSPSPPHRAAAGSGASLPPRDAAAVLAAQRTVLLGQLLLLDDGGGAGVGVGGVGSSNLVVGGDGGADRPDAMASPPLVARHPSLSRLWASPPGDSPAATAAAAAHATYTAAAAGAGAGVGVSPAKLRLDSAGDSMEFVEPTGAGPGAILSPTGGSGGGESDWGTATMLARPSPSSERVREPLRQQQGGGGCGGPLDRAATARQAVAAVAAAAGAAAAAAAAPGPSRSTSGASAQQQPAAAATSGAVRVSMPPQQQQRQRAQRPPSSSSSSSDSCALVSEDASPEHGAAGARGRMAIAPKCIPLVRGGGGGAKGAVPPAAGRSPSRSPSPPRRTPPAGTGTKAPPPGKVPAVPVAPTGPSAAAWSQDHALCIAGRPYQAAPQQQQQQQQHGAAARPGVVRPGSGGGGAVALALAGSNVMERLAPDSGSKGGSRAGSGGSSVQAEEQRWAHASSRAAPGAGASGGSGGGGSTALARPASAGEAFEQGVDSAWVSGSRGGSRDDSLAAWLARGSKGAGGGALGPSPLAAPTQQQQQQQPGVGRDAAVVVKGGSISLSPERQRGAAARSGGGGVAAFVAYTRHRAEAETEAAEALNTASAEAVLAQVQAVIRELRSGGGGGGGARGAAALRAAGGGVRAQGAGPGPGSGGGGRGERDVQGSAREGVCSSGSSLGGGSASGDPELDTRRQELEALHGELQARVSQLHGATATPQPLPPRGAQPQQQGSGALRPPTPPGAPLGAQLTPPGGSSCAAAAALADVEAHVRAKLGELEAWATAEGRAGRQPPAAPGGERKRVAPEQRDAKSGNGSGRGGDAVPSAVLDVLSAAKRRNSRPQAHQGQQPQPQAQQAQQPQPQAPGGGAPSSQQQRQQPSAPAGRAGASPTRSHLEDIEQRIHSRIAQMGDAQAQARIGK